MKDYCPHQTRRVKVWCDCDLGIADMVEYLQTIPSVYTYASCQGTLGEGGADPYRAYVMARWDDSETLERLQREFDVELEGDHWGRICPRPAPVEPEKQP